MKVVPIDRRERIIEYLNKKKFVLTSELYKELFVSPATIRRDLVELEKQGLIIRSRGGARLVPRSNVENVHSIREDENREQKSMIAEMAATFIEDGFSIFLDSSTTTNAIVPFLKEFVNLTIITNGVKTALDLSYFDNCKVVVVGGVISSNSTSIVGTTANEMIQNYNVDLALFSCRGYNHSGIYEANEEQARVKQKMIQNSEKRLLLCDSTKFNHKYFYNLTDFANVQYLITEKKPNVEAVKKIEQNGTIVLEC